jgi:hypothetical protein
MFLEDQGFAYMNFDDLVSLNWPRLEKIARLKFSKTHRKTLLQTLNAYISAVGAQWQRPRVKEARTYLQKLNTHASGLASLLGQASVSQQAARSLAFPWPESETDAVKHVLYRLALGAAAAEQQLSGSLGRPEATFRVPLIRGWLAVYTDAGGSREDGCVYDRLYGKYRGPFLGLLVVALREADHRLIDKGRRDRSRRLKITRSFGRYIREVMTSYP